MFTEFSSKLRIYNCINNSSKSVWIWIIPLSKQLQKINLQLAENILKDIQDFRNDAEKNSKKYLTKLLL